MAKDVKDYERNARSAAKDSFLQMLKLRGKSQATKLPPEQRKISCPFCRSLHTFKIASSARSSSNYQCKSCNGTFNLENYTFHILSGIQLSTWIKCWYLLGCTNSINYIAVNLNVDLNIARAMVQVLRKALPHPIVNLLSYDEWFAQNQNIATSKVNQTISKLDVLLGKEISIQPEDTAEYRRQKAKPFLNKA